MRFNLANIIFNFETFRLLSWNWLEEKIWYSWPFAFLSDYSTAETNEHLPGPYQESLRAGSRQNPSSKEGNYFVTPAQLRECLPDCFSPFLQR
ncbi:hypothetical protein EK904_003968 [Melospiza melodia maxima]|nr:hypothetical protein EK904_003968 [Melospiza melodia maxima]